MKMIKFKLADVTKMDVWINPDKVTFIKEDPYRKDCCWVYIEGAKNHMLQVQGSPDDVAQKLSI